MVRPIVFMVICSCSLLCFCGCGRRRANGHSESREVQTAGKADKETASEGYPVQSKKLDFSLCYDFRIKKGRPDILLRVNIPKTMQGRQKILEVLYSRQPSRIFSKNGNDYAEFVFRRAQEPVKVEIRIKADLIRYDLATGETRPLPNTTDKRSLKAFLKKERMIEKSHPEIEKTAKDVEGDTNLEVVQNIYEYVIEHIEPNLSPLKGSGALAAARTGKGMCIDYCDLFVALCRAKDIPARVVGGYKTQFNVCPKHAWTEVYFPEYGWMPFDVTYGENVPPSIRRHRFMNLKPMYIAFTHVRNDEVLYNCYTHWYEANGDIRCDHSVVFREPVKRTYRGP
jgi:hypothetical protein